MTSGSVNCRTHSVVPNGQTYVVTSQSTTFSKFTGIFQIDLSRDLKVVEKKSGVNITRLSFSY
jgi:hypothetical protein